MLLSPSVFGNGWRALKLSKVLPDVTILLCPSAVDFLADDLGSKRQLVAFASAVLGLASKGFSGSIEIRLWAETS